MNVPRKPWITSLVIFVFWLIIVVGGGLLQVEGEAHTTMNWLKTISYLVPSLMTGSSICIRLMLYNMPNIYSYMGKRGPNSKFTDVACPNEACEDHGVAGHGNIIGNGTYQARNATVRRYICHSCGKAFCGSTNTVYYNLRKDESTIDLALSISIKGMSNESTA